MNSTWIPANHQIHAEFFNPVGVRQPQAGDDEGIVYDYLARAQEHRFTKVPPPTNLGSDMPAKHGEDDNLYSMEGFIEANQASEKPDQALCDQLVRQLYRCTKCGAEYRAKPDQCYAAIAPGSPLCGSQDFTLLPRYNEYMGYIFGFKTIQKAEVVYEIREEYDFGEDDTSTVGGTPEPGDAPHHQDGDKVDAEERRLALHGQDLRHSLRYEDEYTVVFDRVINPFSRAHVIAMPTDVFCPDIRYLFANPKLGKELVHRLEASAWLGFYSRVAKPRGSVFLRNAAFKKETLSPVGQELLERSAETNIVKGVAVRESVIAYFTYTPKIYGQLQLQYLLPPVFPHWYVRGLSEQFFPPDDPTMRFPLKYIYEALCKFESAGESIANPEDISIEDLIARIDRVTDSVLDYQKALEVASQRVMRLSYKFGNYEEGMFNAYVRDVEGEEHSKAYALDDSSGNSPLELDEDQKNSGFASWASAVKTQDQQIMGWHVDHNQATREKKFYKYPKKGESLGPLPLLSELADAAFKHWAPPKDNDVDEDDKKTQPEPEEEAPAETPRKAKTTFRGAADKLFLARLPSRPN